MCFPVYKMINGSWKLHAVYVDFEKLMEEWNVKYGHDKGFCWEPWPVDQPFEEAMKGM